MSGKKSINILIISFYLITILLIGLLIVKSFVNSKSQTVEVVEKKPVPAVNEFGFVADSMKSDTEHIKRNETLSDILQRYNVKVQTIAALGDVADSVFNIRKIIAGKPYRVFTKENEQDKLCYFVYEKDPVNYVVFNFMDTLAVYTGEKKVTVEEKTVAGRINQNLYTTLVNSDVSPELVIELSEVFAWQIDFYHIQKGDNFKVIYEEKYVDGKPFGIGKIIGAYFNHYGEDYYAVAFDQGNGTEYFDENGKSLRKAFLKAPLKYSRISSRYSTHRFHPILKRYKSHLGTDYAAPTGTPIHAVGDGVVIEASYSGGNGRYVKIRHNSVYTTQYLHMSRFAKGIKRGVKVKQGDVIGYVGSTGLATGPHLCYRFWKNGSQVDPLREKIPPSKPVKKEYLDAYNKRKAEVLKRLDSLKIPPPEEKVAA